MFKQEKIGIKIYKSNSSDQKGRHRTRHRYHLNYLLPLACKYTMTEIFFLQKKIPDNKLMS